MNGIPQGYCADPTGEGFLTTGRPDVGNRFAPSNSVALLADPTCRSNSAGYELYANGSATPTLVTNAAQVYQQARFVQVPLGWNNNSGGNAGRNILTGPGIVDFDFALYKQFHWGENKTLEFRWEVYDVFNNTIYGAPLGNVFISNSEPTPGFSFSPHASAAGITGVIPENALDGTTTGGAHDFLNRGNMNTGNRTMQFGIHFSF